MSSVNPNLNMSLDILTVGKEDLNANIHLILEVGP